MLQRSPSQTSRAPLDLRNQNPSVISPEVQAGSFFILGQFRRAGAFFISGNLLRSQVNCLSLVKVTGMRGMALGSRHSHRR
ncbi:hypothetical protein TIFTF001_008852 [Ficus carica]|uniref:Uncharacterized protein n=1 Tax=Ficus carica TaxID=3494 RepID=A0AA88DH88_FICCA|nr:hypothetical protein TIFTF001_008852 [Ficus carica]